MKTRLLMKFKPFMYSRFARFMVLSIGIVVLASAARAQTFPFVLRNTWDGPYDIRMIAAPNLEAVYANPSEAASSRLKTDSIIRHETILMTGKLLNVNNRFKGGSPFNTVDVPLSALKCPSPNAPCYEGLIADGVSVDCPGGKFKSKPDKVSKIIAMNYADYDTDKSTFSSSMAQLDISDCSEIEAAYLYWTGNFKGGAANVTLSPNSSYTGADLDVFNVTSGNANYRSVLLKRPGGAYQTVTASATVPTAGVNNTGTRTESKGYLCVANVTNLLQGTGGGQFWVGNLRSYPHEGDGGSTSGWVLVVISKSPLSAPRRISLWDGYYSINGTTLKLDLTGLQAPSTVTGFQSYIGFAALDGENLATELTGGQTPEDLVFKTDNGPTVNINPLCSEQPKYRLWQKDGLPANASGSSLLDDCNRPDFGAAWASVCDGISSSHITSYDPVSNKNGNEIVRLPANKNTLGIDVHHIKLKSGDIAANATSATLTVESGPQGGTTPFLAYIAIERLQPKLEMTKASNVTTTGTDTEILYTLKVKNTGNSISMGSTKGGDVIRDTLDQATTYVAGSLSTLPTGAASFTSSTTLGDGRQSLIFNVSKQILAKDSITITFKVKVKDFASNQNLWVDQCKRTITNTAWITYNTPTTVVLTSKSNGNDCGIGSETRVLIQDPLFAGSTDSTKLGPFNACPYITASVLTKVREQLIAAGVAAADVDKYDIRNHKYQRINADSLFGEASNYVYYAIRDLAGGSGACQKVYVLRYTTCTLPLDLVSFDAEQVQDGAVLYWTVSSNRATHFVIERSTDGVHFSEVAILNPDGKRSYSYWDHYAIEGTVYYRLMHKEVSGSKSYSRIVSLGYNANLEANFYPNPFAGTVQLVVRSESESLFSINILDVSGKLVASSTGHTTGESITLGKELLAGVYIVEVVREGQKTAHRLVKLY